MARIVDWNGKDFPEGFRTLPPGRYLIEPVEDERALTPEEEEGIREAIRSLEAGHARSLALVRKTISAAVKR